MAIAMYTQFEELYTIPGTVRKLSDLTDGTIGDFQAELLKFRDDDKDGNYAGPKPRIKLSDWMPWQPRAMYVGSITSSGGFTLETLDLNGNVVLWHLSASSSTYSYIPYAIDYITDIINSSSFRGPRLQDNDSSPAFLTWTGVR